MSARISPKTDIIQGVDIDGDAIDVQVRKDGKLEIDSDRLFDMLEQVLVELKTIKYHMIAITGEEL